MTGINAEAQETQRRLKTKFQAKSKMRLLKSIKFWVDPVLKLGLVLNFGQELLINGLSRVVNNL